jgi:hypothetical protein
MNTHSRDSLNRDKDSRVRVYIGGYSDYYRSYVSSFKGNRGLCYIDS